MDKEKMACKQASYLISQSHDRKLSRFEKTKMDFHLFICRSCTNYSRQIKSVRQFAGRLGTGLFDDMNDVNNK